MDLSGSMQGAGGVGGLLAVNETSASYYPTFDGNGNVSEYVEATGTSVAHYEYDAFGQAVASGTKANDFSHQFSTKQFDAESGLHYYGYRYYDSANGRWLARDPIEERGGVNVYGFVENNTISWIDILGGEPYKTIEERVREWKLLPQKERDQIIAKKRQEASDESEDRYCRIEVDLSHGGMGPRYPTPSKLPSRCEHFRYGAVGCGAMADFINDMAEYYYVGIANMPRNNGGNIGVDQNNGKYAANREGFVKYLQAAWDAALAEAEDMCKYDCCKKIKISFKADGRGADSLAEQQKTRQRVSAKRLLKLAGLDEWINKEKIIDCEK